MMDVTAVIQARIGSSRLPGKVMYPLDGRPALGQVISRVSHAENVTNVVVATSTEPHDDVIATHAREQGVSVVRGSESNVLKRYEKAIEEFDPHTVARITGDCPLISAEVIDFVIDKLYSTKADYCTNVLERTFPRGLDVECFTSESFKTVREKSSELHQKEHVTPYYRENQNQFAIASVSASEVFDESWLHSRDDLRLTLDEAPDYELLRQIYKSVPYGTILPIRDAIRYVDENDLTVINELVNQKET